MNWCDNLCQLVAFGLLDVSWKYLKQFFERIKLIYGHGYTERTAPHPDGLIMPPHVNLTKMAKTERRVLAMNARVNTPLTWDDAKGRLPGCKPLAHYGDIESCVRV